MVHLIVYSLDISKKKYTDNDHNIRLPLPTPPPPPHPLV